MTPRRNGALSATQQAAYLLTQHEHTILNALELHAQRMDAAAAEARATAEARPADAEVEAGRMVITMTNDGLRNSALLFEQEAARARRVCEDIQAWSELDDGDEDGL